MVGFAWDSNGKLIANLDWDLGDSVIIMLAWKNAGIYGVLIRVYTLE